MIFFLLFLEGNDGIYCIDYYIFKIQNPNGLSYYYIKSHQL